MSFIQNQKTEIHFVGKHNEKNFVKECFIQNQKTEMHFEGKHVFFY